MFASTERKINREIIRRLTAGSRTEAGYLTLSPLSPRTKVYVCPAGIESFAIIARSEGHDRSRRSVNSRCCYLASLQRGREAERKREVGQTNRDFYDTAAVDSRSAREKIRGAHTCSPG